MCFICHLRKRQVLIGFNFSDINLIQSIVGPKTQNAQEAHERVPSEPGTREGQVQWNSRASRHPCINHFWLRGANQTRTHHILRNNPYSNAQSLVITRVLRAATAVYDAICHQRLKPLCHYTRGPPQVLALRKPNQRMPLPDISL